MIFCRSLALGHLYVLLLHDLNDGKESIVIKSPK